MKHKVMSRWCHFRLIIFFPQDANLPETLQSSPNKAHSFTSSHTLSPQISFPRKKGAIVNWRRLPSPNFIDYPPYVIAARGLIINLNRNHHSWITIEGLQQQQQSGMEEKRKVEPGTKSHSLFVYPVSPWLKSWKWPPHFWALRGLLSNKETQFVYIRRIWKSFCAHTIQVSFLAF